MPLDANRLRNNIIARLDSAFNVPSPGRDIVPADRQTAIDIIVDEVISEIQDNALVSGTCPPNGGPLTGGSIS